MADVDPALPSESAPDEPTPVVLPRTAYPPPPDVRYTRPSLSGQPRVSHSSPDWSAKSQIARDQGTDTPGHGAGLAAGTTFVVSIIAGAAAGDFIDKKWDHTGMPWATLIMTLLGATSGFMNMQRILSRSDRNKK